MRTWFAYLYRLGSHSRRLKYLLLVTVVMKCFIKSNNKVHARGQILRDTF